MPLSLKSFAQFKSDMISSFVSLQQIITDFSVGSVSNALFESISTQLGFVQNQAIDVLATTRAATSKLPDLITFVADYFLYPAYLPATFGTGYCVFVRFQAPALSVVLLDGTIVQNQTPTPALALQAITIADPTDANWSPNAGGPGIPGRIMQAGQLSISALVQSLVPGSQGQFAANTLTVIASAGVPFDAVTNPFGIANGSDAETIQALQIRFQKYISSLPKASLNAVGAAILSTQAGITFCINEGKAANGTTLTSNSAIVVDDGSGATPAPTLLLITQQVDLVRAAGPSRSVTAAAPVTITIVLSGSAYYANFSPGAVATALQSAIISWVNSNGVGGANVDNGYAPSGLLSYVGLLAVIANFIGTDVGQGYLGFTSATINGGVSNVPISGFQVARATASTVTIT